MLSRQPYPYQYTCRTLTLYRGNPCDVIHCKRRKSPQKATFRLIPPTSDFNDTSIGKNWNRVTVDDIVSTRHTRCVLFCVPFLLRLTVSPSIYRSTKGYVAQGLRRKDFFQRAGGRAYSSILLTLSISSALYSHETARCIAISNHSTLAFMSPQTPYLSIRWQPLIFALDQSTV